MVTFCPIPPPPAAHHRDPDGKGQQMEWIPTTVGPGVA